MLNRELFFFKNFDINIYNLLNPIVLTLLNFHMKLLLIVILHSCLLLLLPINVWSQKCILVQRKNRCSLKVFEGAPLHCKFINQDHWTTLSDYALSPTNQVIIVNKLVEIPIANIRSIYISRPFKFQIRGYPILLLETIIQVFRKEKFDNTQKTPLTIIDLSP